MSFTLTAEGEQSENFFWLCSQEKVNLSHLKGIHLGSGVGIFWVGMCHPGLQIGTLFYKKFPSNIYPVLEMGQFFYTPFENSP